MFDNHDEISGDAPRHSDGTWHERTSFPEDPRDSLDGDCQRNGSVDFAGWRYCVPPKMSLILFRQRPPDEIVGPL